MLEKARVLVFAGAVIAALGTSSTATADTPSCANWGMNTKTCGDASADGATISVDRDVPGEGGEAGGTGPQRPPGISDDIWMTHYCSRPTGCYRIDSPATPTITLHDLESFAPQPGTLRTQPQGWGIRGLPMNPLIDASPSVTDATILGIPVRVRFTPVSFDWNYGDGTTRTTTTAGAPWQTELTDTATSHRYVTDGPVPLTATVHYAAAYATTGPWVQLAGEVTRTTAPQTLLIVTERTVLTR